MGLIGGSDARLTLLAIKSLQGFLKAGVTFIRDVGGYSGIDILLREAGMETAEVARLYLAGGFGSAMRPESAARIGLIPEELSDRVTVLGNAAGSGALRYATEEGAAESALGIIRRTRYIELSAHAGFTDAYVERMLFPERE